MSDNIAELDIEILKYIEQKTAKGLVRNCARNSMHHLERAFKIKDVDPEMAVFRSITAEEEAATAIFIALKEKHYNNADKIQYKKHPYKQALGPFIRAIGKFSSNISNSPGFPFEKKYSLYFEGEGVSRSLKLVFHFQGLLVEPTPPLGFHIQTDDGKPYYFENELKQITSGQSKQDIINHIKDISNMRNRLLYATTEGMPIVKNIDGHLEMRQRTVKTFLRILCLISPYKEKALFVQQALDAFLVMMGEIETIVES